MFFVLTGAGISAESGVMTFRGDGLWDGVPVTDVAYPDAFEKDPERVCLFYDRFREKVLAARPNPAHLALARLEDAFPGQVTVVTQNVDDLHERAGSRNVIHIHGSVLKGRCALCGEGRDVGAGFVATPPCPCGGKARPDIVWFTEQVMRGDEIEKAFLAASVFLCVGTSGEVYPAADYARRARNRKLKTVEFNLRSTVLSHYFRECRFGTAGDRLPAFVDAKIRDLRDG